MEVTSSKNFIKEKSKRIRYKDYKCTYPGCSEPAKTRYNCTSHVWDAHLKFLYKEFNGESYKKVFDKQRAKTLCENYMQYVVDENHKRKRKITEPKHDSFNCIKDDFTLTSPIHYSNENMLGTLSPPSELLLSQNGSDGFFNDMPNTFEPSNPPLLLSPSPNTLIQQQSFYPVQNDSFLQVIKLSPSLKRLYVLGAVFAENGFLQRSDERTKTRIIPIQNALIRLMNVSGKSFQYNSSTTTRYGFIAQELKKEFPELVKEDDNGYLSVDPISLIPFIVESVKQLDNDLQPHLKTYDITAAILDESKKLLNELNQFQNVFTFSLGPRILTLPLAIFTTIFSAISSIAWSSLPFIWIFFIILSGGLFYSSRTSNATNTHGIKMSISFFVLLAIMCSAFTFVVGSSFRVVSIYFVSVLIIWGCGQFIGHWKVWFYSFLFISLLCIGILFGMASHQPGYTCKATVSDDFVFVNRTPWNCLSPELGFVFNNNDVIWVGLKGESLMKPFHGNSTVGVKLKCSEVVNFECGEIKL